MNFQKQKILIGLIFSIMPLFCVNVNAGQDVEQNSLKKFSRSIQFRLITNESDSSGGSMLKNFQGFSISGKFHLTNRDALRLGFTFTQVNLNGQKDIYYENTDVDTSFSRSYLRIEDSDDYRGGIDIQYIRYISDGKTANLYLGCGPYSHFSRMLIQYNYLRPSSESNESSSVDTTGKAFYQYYLSFGFTGIIGIEWFPSKSISLHAEYGLSLEYKYSWDIDQYYTGENRLEIKRWKYSIYNNPIKLGISIYF